MARSGLYVQLDSNFPDDDKIEQVGLAGAGLYATSLCVAKRLLTDGRLTRRKLYALGADDALIDRCVEVGLYREDEAGVWIVAWLGHNPSADAIDDKRGKDAARKRKSRQAKRQTDGVTSGDGPGGHDRDMAVTGGGQNADGVTQAEEETEAEETPPAPPVEAAIDLIADRLVAEAVAAGGVRSRSGIRKGIVASARTDHSARLADLARQHPEWNANQLADAVLARGVPLEASKHPAVIEDRRRREREALEDDPPASPETVAAAKAAALAGLHKIGPVAS